MNLKILGGILLLFVSIFFFLFSFINIGYVTTSLGEWSYNSIVYQLLVFSLAVITLYASIKLFLNDSKTDISGEKSEEKELAGSEDPIEVLKKKFAEGEISEEEFKKKKEVLKE